MANFKTHLVVAVVASLTLSAAGFAGKLFGVSTAVFGVLIGTVGGLLPDIDLKSSRPAKKGFHWASILLATLLAILYAAHQIGDDVAVMALALWVVSFFVLKFIVFETFSRLTVHRGMVHSVPYMTVFALMVVYGAFYGLKLTAFVSWIFGAFLWFGSLVHLLLDELYSVNIWGLKLKKSSGTAFKFFESKKPMQYAILYALLGLMYVFAPPYDEAWQALTETVINFIN